MSWIPNDDIDALKRSGSFDGPSYRARYPDVAISGIEAAEHFLGIGVRLGRDGSPASSHERIKTWSLGPAKLIAFYLPQFHPIPENDLWWGEGFTEWTNVRLAKPQFEGHHQPLVPHSSIGYYSLTDPNTIRKQVDCARAYGLHGFCIYYYWFAGRRLLEKPLNILLENRDIDFPFCICWANENWTRRWDGLDQDVLIAQKHSPEDDLACIEDLWRYASDSRYIRIDGKPLIIVYRPELLPDARATADRWRRWARQRGLGELYLACIYSFQRADPRHYGFDGAIDFPPINSSPHDVTSITAGLNPEFKGSVFDWGVFLDRRETSSVVDYPVFAGVNPSWDNTARKKNLAHIFAGSTPDRFQLWLDRAICQTIEARRPSERLVFINAWNEWAEGAVLEPRADNGFSNLQAMKNALDRNSSGTKLAVAIHAFYPEVLPDILESVRWLPPETKLFVSCVEQGADQVLKLLRDTGREYGLYVLENHGRDVLPFLTILPDIEQQGFDVVAKVHTKRSDHRGDGNQWRTELCDAVIGLASVNKAIAALLNDPTIGMVGPARHFVPMTTYLGSNRERLLSYSAMLGYTKEEVLELGFFAGTMFIARVAAIRQITRLGITPQAFESEKSQIDGTLAHVLERVISVCVYASGYRAVDNDDTIADISMNRKYGFA